MRSSVQAAALSLAFLALGASLPGIGAANAAKKKPVCVEKRVPVRYCVMNHRARLDCSGKVWRYDRVCR